MILAATAAAGPAGFEGLGEGGGRGEEEGVPGAEPPSPLVRRSSSMIRSETAESDLPMDDFRLEIPGDAWAGVPGAADGDSVPHSLAGAQPAGADENGGAPSSRSEAIAATAEAEA